MNKRLAFVLVLATISSSAFATKARLQALGETETSGSLYFSDNRNVFLNSAYVNNYKDFMTLEWGAEGQVGTKKDKDFAPQAEGGVFKSFGNLVGGVYLGGESAITHEARQYIRLVDTANPKIHQDNQLDLFLGGDMGVKWGANVTYSDTNDDKNNMDQKSLSTRWGVIAEEFQAFFNVALQNKAEADGKLAAGKDEFEGKLGFEVGGNYSLPNDYKAFIYWRHAKFETKTVTAATIVAANDIGPAYQGDAEFKTNKYNVGFGRDVALNDKARLFTKLEYVGNSRKVETKDGDADLTDYSIPVTFAIEYDATSWLTLRGSAAQTLISSADNDYDSSLLPKINPAVLGDLKPKKRTFNNTTSVNTGATLKFGNLAFDGLIGTSTAGTVSSTSKQGNLSLDNLMSRVAMTYSF